jgi:dTDP-glucose 4,6-dehydratase
MSILVTGAAGFIGSNFVLDWFLGSDEDLVSLDLLTYAGNLNNLSSLEGNPHHHFVKGNIGDEKLIVDLFKTYKFRAVINFAAESHVDRSIHQAGNFIDTNILGTYQLLESVRLCWNDFNEKLQKKFRFLHVSTDEVYGSLEKLDKPFSETSRYEPSNPYSASKASSDHLVRAWHRTYSLPTLITNCSNNYGPYQFPEKLIPLSIINALIGKSIPIYGDGKNIRDWLYVKDHCSAIRNILNNGSVGEVYNIGGSNEKTNLEVVRMLCDILDEIKPLENGLSYSNLITFVKDRPGHDRRYALNATKLEKNLKWKPSETFETGIKKTVEWYLENPEWIKKVLNGDYKNWVQKHYE